MAPSDSELSEQKSRFGDRFGYVRWLKHLELGEPLTHKEIADAIGRTAPAVGAWLGSENAPKADLDFYELVAGWFGVDVNWLFRGRGDAPHPELWAAWIAARERLRPVRAVEMTPEHFAPAPRHRGRAKRRKRGNDR